MSDTTIKIIDALLKDHGPLLRYDNSSEQGVIDNVTGNYLQLVQSKGTEADLVLLNIAVEGDTSFEVTFSPFIMSVKALMSDGTRDINYYHRDGDEWVNSNIIFTTEVDVLDSSVPSHIESVIGVSNLKDWFNELLSKGKEEITFITQLESETVDRMGLILFYDKALPRVGLWHSDAKLIDTLGDTALVTFEEDIFICHSKASKNDNPILKVVGTLNKTAY